MWSRYLEFVLLILSLTRVTRVNSSLCGSKLQLTGAGWLNGEYQLTKDLCQGRSTWRHNNFYLFWNGGTWQVDSDNNCKVWAYGWLQGSAGAGGNDGCPNSLDQGDWNDADAVVDGCSFKGLFFLIIKEGK